MAFLNGLQCSRNNFWKLLHNPVYCGLVTVPPTKTEDIQFVKSVHELISESLFKNVQLLLNSKRRQYSRREDLKYLFPLRGFLQCPWCNRKLTGSISQGSKSKYRYYHCASVRCKGRFRADILDRAYEEQLQRIRLVPEVYELFELVLQDENILSAQKDHADERKTLLDEIAKQQSLMSKARKLLLAEKIDLNDFSELKREYKQALEALNDRLIHVNKKLSALSCNDGNWLPQKESGIFQSFRNQDIAGKRHIINLLSPTAIDPLIKTLGPLRFNDAIAKVIRVSEKAD